MLKKKKRKQKNKKNKIGEQEGGTSSAQNQEAGRGEGRRTREVAQTKYTHVSKC
jgi:hypothetical protein